MKRDKIYILILAMFFIGALVMKTNYETAIANEANRVETWQNEFNAQKQRADQLLRENVALSTELNEYAAESYK